MPKKVLTHAERIKAMQKRITEIWAEMEPEIAGTGVASLIEELVELEIEIERWCNE